MTKLKKIIKKRKIVGRTMAVDIGVKPCWLSQVVNARRIPSRKLAIKISNYLDGEISPSEILSIK